MADDVTRSTEALISAWNRAWTKHEETTRELSSFRVLLVRFLHAQGWTMEKIAEKLGLTRQRVGQILKSRPSKRG